MLVLDNSALIALLVGSQATSGAVARRLSADRVVAPELIDAEALSALRGLRRGRQITAAQAEAAITGLRTLPIERVPHRDLITAAWHLRDRLSAYDALYVALAGRIGVPLLTGDRRLRDGAGDACEVELIG
ncbi:type II toxin-antitoxin system VapC family toxin [Nocardioides sp. Kera G14]|uniref:type II toxin-antitoxin system VapC family toxin n=1 Tax=Nocardioides sp. Kera G14 TaxID=2884264 RepID=UPI001D118CF6|nr:type II toxin-antitoxin system VapC family toxin [Nocardioides sp. Kera G14]UDY23378.1 type II toxin-antitoxin system VapC family toxin [Nocardioides sp. Kera G14]